MLEDGAPVSTKAESSEPDSPAAAFARPEVEQAEARVRSLAYIAAAMDFLYPQASWRRGNLCALLALHSEAMSSTPGRFGIGRLPLRFSVQLRQCRIAAAATISEDRPGCPACSLAANRADHVPGGTPLWQANPLKAKSLSPISGLGFFAVALKGNRNGAEGSIRALDQRRAQAGGSPSRHALERIARTIRSLCPMGDRITVKRIAEAELSTRGFLASQHREKLRPRSASSSALGQGRYNLVGPADSSPRPEWRCGSVRKIRGIRCSPCLEWARAEARIF